LGPRIILITGKGGVGKTSVAAATARRCAAGGLRTIVVSTDPAHSLSDVLGLPLGADPVAIGERLTGAEISTQDALERNWAGMQAWLGEALVRRGMDRISAEELAVPPGLDELFCLLELKRLHESGDVDCIVVDCAPTAETLRLLSFPEVAHWWLERIVPRQGRLLEAARPLARAVLDMALPGEEVLDEVARLMANLVDLNALLRDHRRVSVRLVMTPEQMVVAETRRTFTYLNLYGFQTDAVIVNRVFPREVGPYFDAWRTRQVQLIEEARAGFSPVPMLTAPYFEEEVRGPEMLDRLGERAFAGIDVAAVLHDGVSEHLRMGEDEASLRLELPFARKGDIAVKRLGRELIVRVADHKRTIMLPPALDAFQPAGAAFQDGTLTVSLQRG
jgi:arsenite-transporting ATPase